MIACLSSVDTGIRLAAANLVGVLAKDAFYSKSIVFPEPGTPNISAVGGEAEQALTLETLIVVSIDV